MAARLVLYQYDFCDAAACDGYKLSPKGFERLEEIARIFPCSDGQPILIESTPHDAKLDATRRDYVWRSLLQMNVPVPDHLVVVGHPRTPALNGQEAVILHLNLLKQVQSSGAPQSGGAGSTGGSSTSAPNISNGSGSQGQP
jgi:hypothetical protein